MIDRGREKRRGNPLPGAARPARRRGLWLMIGVSLVIFVVVVVFETRRELARQQQIAAPGGATEDQAQTTASAATANSSEPATLLGRLKAHYRSHELPSGWTVGGLDAPTEAEATVRIVFSPSPQDSRYGLSAPADDIAKGAFCPEGSQFWLGLEDRLVAVELSDKSGAVKTIPCAVMIE